MTRRAGALLVLALVLAARAVFAALTPPNLSQPACSANRCTLTWSIPTECLGNCGPGSGIRQWMIERATDNLFLSGFTLVTITAPGATTYTNTGLVNGTTYYWRLRAYPYSNYTSGTPTSSLCGSGGTVCFIPIAASNFDPYTSNPSPSESQWMRDHYTRMFVYTPYFDSRLSWFPNAWVYLDSYAIYNPSSVATNHPEWILKDGSNNKLYIPFGCANGTCPQYAGDIGNPAFRASIVAQAQALATTGYKGVFFDDVNMKMQVGDGAGNLVAPFDPRLGRTMTTTDWRDYMATLCEELRAAIPTKEIAHNQVWFFAPKTDPYVIRAIQAANYVWMERGFDDGGIVGGTGSFGFETALSWLDGVHAQPNRGVVFEPGASLTYGQEYALAVYFLISNGQDGLSTGFGAIPPEWSANWEVNLGTPTGPRTRWNTLFRRDFSGGLVLVNQPGAATVNASLGATYRKLDGTTTTSVSLPARSGIVLRTP